MKRLLSFLLLLSALGWAQSDNTAAPIQLNITDNMVDAVNLSPQPIIEIELQVVGRVVAGANLVFHSTHDLFFKVPLAPGEKREVVEYIKENAPYAASGKALVLDGSGKPVTDANGKPQTAPVSTQVTFLQYADGSTWGTPNPITAANMAKRKGRLVAGHRWLAAYRSGGSDAFTQALASEQTFKAEAASIQYQISQDDADKAAQVLAGRLARADALMATGKF